jgi:DNA-binding MarR family transcriptional regulator
MFDPELPPPTIGALLRLALSAFRTRMFEAVRAAGYDDVQPGHLALFRYPSIANVRPGQLADESGASKQAVNDLLRQLEAKGYLGLEPDPLDARARRITLTPRGKKLQECIRAAAQDVAADWARTVGRERFAAVRKTLLDYIEGSRARQSKSGSVSGEQREPQKAASGLRARPANVGPPLAGADRTPKPRLGRPNHARRRR